MYVDIDVIVDCLDDKKGDFVSKCQTDIERYVSGRGKDSLAIKEIGVRTHWPAPDNYMKVFWKFKNGETYHGHRLESVLSEPISDLVSKNFQDFLEEHKPEIEAQLKQQVADAIDISSTLEKILYDELRKKGIQHIQHEAAEAFINGCQAAFHSSLAQTTSTSVSHTVTNTVGATVGASIAHTLAIAIAHAVGTALIHVAHSVAFKALLKTVIVHSVGAIVTAVLVKMIASHVTAASAGAFLGPAVWVVGGAYIFYKVMTIPETLGEELAEAIGAHLRGEFRSWTETALEECFKNLTDPEKLLQSVVKAEIDSAFPKILTEVDSSYTESPPDYKKVHSEVKELVGYGEKGVSRLSKRWWQW